MSVLEFTCNACGHSYPDLPPLSRCEKCGGKIQARMRHESGDYPREVAAIESPPKRPENPPVKAPKAANKSPARPPGDPEKKRGRMADYEQLRKAMNDRELVHGISLVRTQLLFECAHFKRLAEWEPQNIIAAETHKKILGAIDILQRLSAIHGSQDASAAKPDGEKKDAKTPKQKAAVKGRRPGNPRNREIGPLGGRSKHEPAIFAALKAATFPLTLSEIGRKIGHAPQNFSLVLRYATRSGHLLQTEHGYALRPMEVAE